MTQQVKMPEPVAWRSKYKSEPGMIGQYPWSYVERSLRQPALNNYDIEALITTTQAQAYADARVREMQQWISVGDRLPSNNEPVMFVVACLNPSWKHLHGKVLGGVYRCGVSGGFSVPGITIGASHWMPLPDPPK